ncbi:hypothetical protein GCM10010275_03840 [Streptomyces litmocidini]|uniref:hypothetical protein n=1 Tax=Streptomyces litmocidini TaxID=67318 RepID=UPI00167C84D7|nr:hypothetical protein [Streptomyces litmocidini]GGU72519.1 hypothetical protein GCM10010275_03840 [Streptomyces litmocidini]
MSRETGRETDSSSSGAQGRGGAAYPSGTPPYGSRQYPSLHPTQDAPEETAVAPAPPEEPKTETTLTTRIRINIPGSRPIPPVVVRKTVNETSAPEPEPVAQPEPEPAPAAPAPEPPRAAEEAPQAPKAKETSDWFAPRKAAAPGPAPAPAPAPVAKPAPAQAGPDAPGTGFAGSATSGVPTVGTTPSSRPVTAPTPGNPLYESGTPAGGTPMYDGTPAGGTPLYEGTPAAGTPMYDGTPAEGTPMYDGTPAEGTPMYGGAPAAGAPGHRGPGHPAGQGAPGAPAAPTGPTTGPVTGTASLGGAPAGPRPFGGGQDAGSPFAGGGAPRMSDDTAILTPQQPAPVPGSGPGAPGDGGAHISGDTLTSGIPVVPPTAARPNLTPRIEEHATPAPAPAPRQAPAAGRAPAKKGRSKLVLAAVGVLGVAGVAYGAGLLLNHSDVPKGTTVLGVDIGGGTKEEAVDKLDAVFGKRATTPLQLGVGGKRVQLAPDKAGLALDSQETVRAAAGSDYNPVSVIGSLFGGERVAQPVFPVDKEKLAVALTDLAGTSASATEGTILFSPNKVTPVEGKPGQGLDVQRSMISVQDAFRAQVETGRNKLVELPVTSRRPTITKAELDRAMKEFATPAMSGLIRIQAGGRHIDFGPARSLPQILSMKAVDGRLVEVYDKKAIERLLDGAFDGVMITKGDGSKHQVSADDVAFVMRDALRGKTLAERTKTIDLSGEG